ncbi:TPR-like protein [Mycena kentingensis (nom. inval.)]|nr:TPR-like protein [Mycena kentingensis (nom. inval.)]
MNTIWECGLLLPLPPHTHNSNSLAAFLRISDIMSSNNNIMQLKMEVLEDEAALLLNAIPNPEDFAVERAAHDDVPTNIDEPIPDAYDEDVAMSDVDEGTPPPFPVIDAKPKRVVLRDDSSNSGSDTESEDDSLSSSASSSSSDTSDSEDDTAAVKKEEVNSQIQNDSDGDFERLVENIRASGDGPTTADGGMLAREWDFVVQENTLGTTRKKNNRPPPGSGPVLSAHTKSLIGEGNQAYVDGDLPRAIRIMLEVIRIEPRSPSAWAVLAQCYDEQKELTKGLQLRIMGAHLRMDAEEWDRLARQSKAFGYPQQALYCWQKGHQVNPNNIAGLWDCAMLAQEINDLRTARFAFLGILARYPHDLTILSLVRPILVTLGDLQTCTNLFKATFEHHKKLFPLGCGPSTSPSEEDIKPHLQELRDVPGGGFGEMEVLVLADLYTALGEHERAIEVVRTGIRWLQGRAEENWWDLCTDDREYDPKEPAIVRLLDEVNDIEAGFCPLDINARHRLAVARIKMGDVAEGKVHADMILAEEMLDYAPLFTEIADAYFEVDRMPDARTIYERLGSCEATTSEDVLRKTALCMRAMGDLAAAAEVFETVRKYDPTNNQLKMDLAEIYEILEEPRKALDLVYEVMDSRRRRPRENPTQDDTDADRVPPLIGEKQKPPPPKTMSQMKRLCKPPRLSHAELRALETKKEEEAVAAYSRVRELWAGMKAGEEAAVVEWLVEAKKLIEAFRETRRLFSTSRVYRGMFPVRRTKKRVREEEEEEEQKRMVNRLQLDIAHKVNSRQQNKGLYEASDVFRGIKTDEWLQLFLQYAALLTQRGEYDEGEEVLRHLLVSSAYQQPVYQDRIRLGLVACAAAVGKLSVVVEQIRKIHTAHQWQNEPLRIFVAALSGGNSAAAADAFLNSPFQKYLHREMVLADAAANRPQEVVWSTSHRRFSVNSGCAAGIDVALCSEDEDQEVVIPDKDKTMKKQRLPDIARVANPVLPAIYGQIALVGKSYQSAIYYLLMAHDQCPEDPAIALSLAIASLGRASQRQCDNRQHLVAQAMAFLSRYREHRAAAGEHATSCEIEFNLGRAFHHLGLFSHAARHYERAIADAGAEVCAIVLYPQMGDADFSQQENAGSCAKEAAFNLSLIYVATGARKLAQGLVRRWLSV